jgi:hypothetical protein
VLNILGWLIGDLAGENLIGIGWLGLGALMVKFVVGFWICGVLGLCWVWRWILSYLAWIEISEVWAEKSLWMCCCGGG